MSNQNKILIYGLDDRDVNKAVRISDDGEILMQNTTLDSLTLDSGRLLADTTIQINNVDVSNGNPVPVSDAGGSLTIDNAILDSLTLDSGRLLADTTIQINNVDVSNGNPVPVSDAGGSLTIDNAILDSLTVDTGSLNVSYTNSSLSVLNTTTTPILASTTYTGTYELINNLNDVMVSCKTDQAGTLYFDFSNDGTNTDTFPSNGFSVSANIHEFHVAVKGKRYFRVRLENTSVSNQTYLRLYTYYGNFRQGNLPLNQSISDDSDSIVVRSVGVASNPLETYVNQKADGYRIYTTANLGNGGVYNSGIMDLDGYTQIETQLYADQTGTLVGTWYSDSGGLNVIRTFTRPYSSLTLDYFSAPCFGRYLRYTYTNGATPQTSFFLGFRLLTKSISGQILGLEDFIASNMSVNLGRNVIAGKTEAGSYINAGITNDGELFTNTLASSRQTRALYASGTITTDTYALLVDLSGEPYTNYVSIDNISISCSFSVNNSTTNIKIGVITRVDAVNADVSWLINVPFSTANANTFLNLTNNYQPSAVQFHVSGGSIVNAYTNDTSTTALINTALTLPSARNTNITPAVGDVVIFFDHTGNNFTSTVGAVYHTD
jgi:hypothetical protein